MREPRNIEDLTHQTAIVCEPNIENMTTLKCMKLVTLLLLCSIAGMIVSLS